MNQIDQPFGSHLSNLDSSKPSYLCMSTTTAGAHDLVVAINLVTGFPCLVADTADLDSWRGSETRKDESVPQNGRTEVLCLFGRDPNIHARNQKIKKEGEIPSEL